MKLPIVMLLMGAAAPALGQGQVPHVSGEVRVEPSTGLIDGNLCTTRFSARRDLRFRLNTALNVKEVFVNGSLVPYRGETGGQIIEETRVYRPVVADSGAAPTRLCVTYRGAVPVFEQPTAIEDWKGRITSINGALRASEQARWYPTLFDSATGRDEQLVSFELNVTCTTCRTIYVNGAGSRPGGAHSFASEVPRQMMLYAGDFEATQLPGVSFVGGAAGPAAHLAFNGAITEIAEYFSRAMRIRHAEPPTVLSFQSVARSRPRGRNTWQFVTWPTIAMDGGLPFDSLVVRQSGRPGLSQALWTTLSHEMGHYYFGTLLRPNGPMRWFVLESMAEYLSLKAVRALRGEVAHAARLTAILAEMGAATPPTLDQISSADQITGSYRYQHAPAFLYALELRLGEGATLQFARNLVGLADRAELTFADVADAGERAGISRREWSAGWSVPEIMAVALAKSRSLMGAVGPSPADTVDAIALASNLVTLDTTVAARLQVQRVMQSLVLRDSTLARAHYQIGKVGALTGRELDAAENSLRFYLRTPWKPGTPSIAGAWWRLGQVLEHRGDRAAALAAYSRSLELDPSNVEARQARERLAKPRHFGVSTASFTRWAPV